MSNNQMTRKDFEKPVTYVANYRIYNVIDGFFVDKYAEKWDSDDYEIDTRSLALKALRQFIWDNHKNIGYDYSMDDFVIESMGWYLD